MYIPKVLLCTIFMTCCGVNQQIEPARPETINAMIEKQLQIKQPFFGLASYYNNIKAYIVDKNNIQILGKNFQKLKPDQHLLIARYHHTFPFRNIEGDVALIENKIIWKTTNHQIINKPIVQPFSETRPTEIHVSNIKYMNLWQPLLVLCYHVETALLWLNTIHTFGWGISIILLSLLIKIISFPASQFLAKSQKKVSEIQAVLAPKLEHIKQNFSGEEAHKLLMKTYQDAQVSPFYALKPLVYSLIPIPFSIAVFNVLGECSALSGQSFLWINDLAYPDSIASLGITIPMLGNNLHLLPLIMTLITIISANYEQTDITDHKAISSQKRNLYLMAITFLVLFYPFPSAMVLYWTSTNVWQLILQRIHGIISKSNKEDLTVNAS